MLEAFSIPIWVCYDGNAAIDMKLCHYIPSPKAIADVIEAQKLDQMHGTWGQPDGMWGQLDNGSESVVDWDQAWSQGALGWDLDGGEHRLISAGPQQHVDPRFPVPEQLSGQKPGQDYKVFFTWQRKENKMKEASETPTCQQSCQSHECSAMNHGIPGKSNTAVVFKWQSQDEFNGFLLCIRLTKAQIPMTWGNYNPSSIPDSDWEEDHFLPVPTPSGPPPPHLPPPLLSSFMQDIENYFGHHGVAPSSNYTHGIEFFASILHFHLGFQLTASTHTARDRSTMFEQWIQRTTWINLCKLIGDSGDNVELVADAWKRIITCFIGYLVTLPSSQLSHILSDLWDLGPDSPLLALNANI
ncbi:uncharacterized protein EDB91DRAFT_1248147 [Suillus paluster]|uniref:uncharacterized protein n=1 Tax=Suillus paluster TaxID=48578 RepID=UPI001B86CCF2|nr:uncharacterized protein EDB91DRAFT_1248147 [Suillus paluster]KAG1740752.1 hypothetical protein EDB91DRAFT_1248147 [Suillus paluster]